MKNRVVPGILMVLGWLLVAFGPVFLLKVLVLVALPVALSEYFAMTMPELKGGRRTVAIAIPLLPVLAAFPGAPAAVAYGALLALFALLLTAMRLFGKYGEPADTLRLLGAGAFAILYLGLCGACLLLLGQAEHKSLWLMLLVAITAGSDTGAYYAGRRFGTTKIFPVLSPKKTWAGLWGGLACGVLCAAIVHGLMGGPWSFLGGLVSAALLVLVGVAGDLAESMLKRACGVKDSGAILAGHGGVLDRIDSMLLVAPALYLLLARQGFL